MAVIKLSLLSILLLGIGLGVAAPPEVLKIEGLTIQNADRIVDISSQLVQITDKLKVENTGASPVKYVIFTTDYSMKDHLAFIGATTGKEAITLKVVPAKLTDKPDILVHKIELSTPLAVGKSIDIEVETVFSKYLIPFPSEITQKEKQLAKYIGSHYLYSPYKTSKQTTKVLLASKNIENFTKLKPFSQSDNTITFGAYENIGPFATNECIVHYENNSPFLTITKMERTIEVSHWGNIAIEEHIDILHTGAKLKGSFSRFDYQREHNSGINSIKAFKTILPASAKDVYYRDDIGNISTSNMYVKHDSVELTLRPRFPLFGGWKTRYVIGYNLPSYEYLFNDGSQFSLRMRLLDHVFDSMAVDEYTVKIILPEGSIDLQLETPYELKKLPMSLHFTYLDITGRPVTTLTGKNLVESHIQDFTLNYTFPKIYLLREPLIVVAAFLILFITVLIYVRLDFSISTVKGGSSNKSSGLVESVLRRHAKRAGIYETFESHISKLKTNKDSTAYQAALKTLTAEHKAETQAINDTIVKAKVEHPEVVENLLELQRLDRGFWEIHLSYGQAAEKLVIGKMSRQQFMDQDSLFHKKRDELAEKINQIVKVI